MLDIYRQSKIYCKVNYIVVFQKQKNTSIKTKYIAMLSSNICIHDLGINLFACLWVINKYDLNYNFIVSTDSSICLSPK